MTSAKKRNPTRVIKKNENETYIDSESNEYMTLDELKLLVENNENFLIIDSNTMQDQTREALIEILINIELMTSNAWTTNRLTELIKMRDYESKMEAELNLKSKITNKYNSIKFH